jgi:hypothetical protein
VTIADFMPLQGHFPRESGFPDLNSVVESEPESFPGMLVANGDLEKTAAAHQRKCFARSDGGVCVEQGE